jgi:hypothetical protein
MSIVALPKDVLGLIFQKLWKKDAKALPTTCKLFKLIVTSQRWFKGWKQLEIVIQELPDGIHKSLQQAAIKANLTCVIAPPKKVTVKYDHFDKLHDILIGFKAIINDEHWSTEYHSFYGLDENDSTVTFLQGNYLVDELKKLPLHQRAKIYCSDFSFQELEENRRAYFTWDSIVSCQ